MVTDPLEDAVRRSFAQNLRGVEVAPAAVAGLIRRIRIRRTVLVMMAIVGVAGVAAGGSALTAWVSPERRLPPAHDGEASETTEVDDDGCPQPLPDWADDPAEQRRLAERLQIPEGRPTIVRARCWGGDLGEGAETDFLAEGDPAPWMLEACKEPNPPMEELHCRALAAIAERTLEPGAYSDEELREALGDTEEDGP